MPLPDLRRAVAAALGVPLPVLVALTAGCGTAEDTYTRECDLGAPRVKAVGDEGWACMPRVDGACVATVTDSRALGVAVVEAELGHELGYSDTATGGCEEQYDAVCGPIEGKALAWADDDACCYLVTYGGQSCWDVGRPLRVADDTRVAPARRDGGWARPAPEVDLDEEARAALADGWTAIALAEHASVASFARVVLQLLAVGAPADLVAATLAAQQDEVRHAALAFGLAARYAGAPVGPGPLPTHDALAQGDPYEALLLGTLEEGCLAEGLAAARLAAAAAHTTDAHVRGVIEVLARDETRHAALAWRTVRWVLEVRPDLRPRADAALRELAVPSVPPAPPSPILAAHGLPDADVVARAHEDALAQVLRPAARLLMRPPTEVARA